MTEILSVAVPAVIVYDAVKTAGVKNAQTENMGA